MTAAIECTEQPATTYVVAREKVVAWLQSVLDGKIQEDIDKPLLATQLKYYVLSHPDLMSGLLEERLYSVCYDLVSERVRAMRSAAIDEFNARRQETLERLRNDGVSERAINRFANRTATGAQVRVVEAAARERGLELYPPLATSYVDAVEVVPIGGDVRSEDAARQLESDMRRQALRVDDELRKRRLARWESTKSPLAVYRETVRPHLTKALPKLTGLDIDLINAARQARIGSEQRAAGFLAELRQSLGDNEQVGERYDVDEVERIAAGWLIKSA